MVEIIPAVMPQSFEDLRAHCARLRGAAPVIQIDLLDGAYVSGTTWPYARDDARESLPEEPAFEIDCMVEDARAAIERFPGASRFIVHADAPHALDALALLAPSKRGVALAAGDAPEALDAFSGTYDFVQVMGIDPVGVQGASFDARALDLVAALRAKFPALVISVDGGVSPQNARALARAGASRLVAGSAIFGADDPSAAYRTLGAAANDTISQ
jgi:ribulose-phosphate 3-epimerase